MRWCDYDGGVEGREGPGRGGAGRGGTGRGLGGRGGAGLGIEGREREGGWGGREWASVLPGRRPRPPPRRPDQLGRQLSEIRPLMKVIPR
ncbi:hypothetical protein E2C01_058081 [Portunus trituberculatus]|uniref:Uncharacterized protein n=1 Tax=Portunus trituberculatus TaxID=210409 RepID=A0A5B7H1P5_PORTR|nr:hypothetical protein [Portunus trituberculatus]